MAQQRETEREGDREVKTIAPPLCDGRLRAVAQLTKTRTNAPNHSFPQSLRAHDRYTHLTGFRVYPLNPKPHDTYTHSKKRGACSFVFDDAEGLHICVRGVYTHARTQTQTHTPATHYTCVEQELGITHRGCPGPIVSAEYVATSWL